jgi:hypothetical protein
MLSRLTLISVFSFLACTDSSGDADPTDRTGRATAAAVASEADLIRADPPGAYGALVALDGGVALVAGVNDRTDVFARGDSGWALVRTLEDPGDAGIYDTFGDSAALSGSRAVVGAYGVTGQVGAIYVYDGADGAWDLQATVVPTVPRDQFGADVAIDDTRILVSSVGPTSVILYEASGDAWIPTATFEPDLTWSTTSHFGLASDWYGATGPALAIDGDVIVVGSSGDSEGGTSAGAAYVFERTGSVWSRSVKLHASDSRPGQRFGAAVAVSRDTIVVGAPGDLLTYNGDAGAVYIFDRINGIWMQTARITQEPWVEDDALGKSVALDGECLVAGAPTTFYLTPWGPTATGRGSAHVFCRTGSEWFEQARMVVPDGFPPRDINFGRSVDISGRTVIVGAQWSAMIYEFSVEDGGLCWSCACDVTKCNAPPEGGTLDAESGTPEPPPTDASSEPSEATLPDSGDALLDAGRRADSSRGGGPRLQPEIRGGCACDLQSGSLGGPGPAMLSALALLVRLSRARRRGCRYGGGAENPREARQRTRPSPR